MKLINILKEKLKPKRVILLFFFLQIHLTVFSQVDSAPVISAQGKQVFCPGNSINIVTDFTITDVDDTTIDSFFIQISTGYQVNFDRLELSGNHPNIRESWNTNEGKLTLTSSLLGKEMLLTDLEKAVKEVVFTTTSNNVVSKKSFSLSIGDANYLPLTDHFYEFVDVPNITWSTAKVEAEKRTYYGRQGYLATLTSKEEADFAGKQAAGAGWIGGSDAETEGVWKWVTGPEAGTVFWNGAVSGTTPNFAFWNNNEPNNHKGNNPNGEHYAHITHPTIGKRGAWNDLPNEGGTNLYIPRGYIVEYGKPGDSALKIVASTSIYIPQITTKNEANVCESGVATISVVPSEGNVLWYGAASGGTPLSSGNSFTTPVLNSTSIYYAAISINGCSTFKRTPVTVTVNKKPTITNVKNDLICSGTALLSASTSAGNVYWYDSLSSTVPIFIGENYRTNSLNSTTSFFVEAVDANCKSNVRTEVKAVVDATIPDFELESSSYFICLNKGTVTLKAINFKGNYNYIWTKDGKIISGNTSEVIVDEEGSYKVKAISLAGCESEEKTIIVKNSEIANLTKENVIIVDDSENNSITVINNNGIGDYEYALDNKFGTYKDIGFFENISTGMHSLFIRDKNGCGINKYVFSVLQYPKFFTPNEDGENDTWKIEGLDSNGFTISTIYIYNRFGIVLHKINVNNSGWNGISKGKKMPSSTYWFKAFLIDKNGMIIDKKGNFSLIRK